MNEDILVSIYCLAYNHENYIRDALNGFISQKTKFKYEVIIHDDASTDSTAEIIEEYRKQYPDIIKPIYQKENQYSKGLDIFDSFIYEKINGKYIAVCEGDDYWISEKKLQNQVDFLEGHPNYSACTHCVKILDCRNNSQRVFNPTYEDYSFDVYDFLPWNNKRYLSSSLVAKKEYFSIPQEIKMKKVGDYPRAVHLALKGPIYYMKEVYSVYRYYAQGSWTRNNKGTNDQAIFNINEKNDFLIRFNEYTSQRFENEISLVIIDNELEIALYKRDYKKIYEGLSKTKNNSLRIRVLANLFFPNMCKWRRIILKRD